MALQQAQERAMAEQTQLVMAQVPKTAAGFNRDFKALKNNSEQQMQFLKKIPVSTIQGFFKNTELDAEIFGKILRTLAELTASPDECIWAHNFMMALSSAYKFDTTLMLVGNAESQDIQTIINKIRKVDRNKASQLEQEFAE